jgi:hypothetical protein
MADKSKPADDWEHVADDAFSVISLPSDDEDAPVIIPRLHGPSSPHPSEDPWVKKPNATIPDLMTGAKTVPTLPISIRPAVADPSSQPTRGPPPLLPISQAAQPSMPKPDNGKAIANDGRMKDDAHTLARVLAQPSQNDSRERSAEQASRTQAVEHDNNPVTFLAALRSLARVVQATVSAAPDIQPHSSRTVQRIAWVCKMLYQQIQDLEPIVAGYAKTWEEQDFMATKATVYNFDATQPRDLPLDPSLYTWIIELQRKLLAVQAEIKKQAKIAPVPGLTDLGELETLVDSLSDFEKHMDDFLPIMQVYGPSPFPEG